ncbi:MAG: Rrf2 family transcriptional regulator [Hyphomicrobiaceae bacterium]|nr:Rrf2 family transcriptional regulator [Hyphomicrobiaceae bacterium]
MRLQISSRLAIFALVELAADPTRQASVADIGEKYGASAHHLAKVMNALGRAGLVQSVRGVGGGYRFVGNARRVTLLDVILLFEEMSPGGSEQGETVDRTEAGEALQHVLREVDDFARATFGSITIATMLKLVERRRQRKEEKRAASHVEA